MSDEEARVRAFAQEHWEDFAAILRDVLPARVRMTWREDPGFKRWFDEWQTAGFTLLPNHFYGPVPHVSALGEALTRPIALHGVSLRTDAQISLLGDLATFKPEYDAFLTRGPGALGLFRFGAGFPRIDAELTYAMLRRLKPKRVVEIGAGMSTLLMAEALRANETDGAPPAHFTSIDPGDLGILSEPFEGLSERIQKPVQDVPLEVFEALEDGDVLFIDSTHVLHPGNDVEHEYFNILPTLRRGVYIHIHDIFLPRPYHPRWLTEERIFWNEQYLLAAFLSFNTSFEVVMANNYLRWDHPDCIAGVISDINLSDAEISPGSFWIRRIA